MRQAVVVGGLGEQNRARAAGAAQGGWGDCRRWRPSPGRRVGGSHPRGRARGGDTPPPAGVRGEFSCGAAGGQRCGKARAHQVPPGQGKRVRVGEGKREGMAGGRAHGVAGARALPPNPLPAPPHPAQAGDRAPASSAPPPEPRRRPGWRGGPPPASLPPPSRWPGPRSERPGAGGAGGREWADGWSPGVGREGGSQRPVVGVHGRCRTTYGGAGAGSAQSAEPGGGTSLRTPDCARRIADAWACPADHARPPAPTPRHRLLSAPSIPILAATTTPHPPSRRQPASAATRAPHCAPPSRALGGEQGGGRGRRSGQRL